MPRVRRDYNIPIPYDMDSHVLVPCRGQTISRTLKIPYVEIQTVFPKWNNEGTSRRQSAIRNLVPIAESPNDQMEGAPEHSMKSTQNCPHLVRTRPYRGVVHARHQGKGKDSRLLPDSRRNFPGVSSTVGYKIVDSGKGKRDRLINIRATERPRERRIL